MHNPSKQFVSGQVVFEVPSYRLFHRLEYRSSSDRPQPQEFAWVVGPSGEFYRKNTQEGQTQVRGSDREKEFRATWAEALEASLEDVRRQAGVVADIVAEEVLRTDAPN